jgi:hypothetical protein
VHREFANDPTPGSTGGGLGTSGNWQVATGDGTGRSALSPYVRCSHTSPARTLSITWQSNGFSLTPRRRGTPVRHDYSPSPLPISGRSYASASRTRVRSRWRRDFALISLAAAPALGEVSSPACRIRNSTSSTGSWGSTYMELVGERQLSNQGPRSASSSSWSVALTALGCSFPICEMVDG